MLMLWYNRYTLQTAYTTHFPDSNGILVGGFSFSYYHSIGYFIDKWDVEIDVKERGWQLSTQPFGDPFYIDMLVFAFHGRKKDAPFE